MNTPTFTGPPARVASVAEAPPSTMAPIVVTAPDGSAWVWNWSSRRWDRAAVSSGG